MKYFFTLDLFRFCKYTDQTDGNSTGENNTIEGKHHGQI